MASVNNMGFLYPGLNTELHYRLDNDKTKATGKFYPIGASPELRDSSSTILQMREVAMMIFMNGITDKDRWHEKVLDDDLVTKWKEEALSMSERGLYDRIVWEKQPEKIPFPEEGRIMSEECIDYCFAELRDKAKYFQQTNLVPALDSAGNAVAKSDSLISKDLHEELGDIFKTLAADQRGNEDWHPGSNEMQLNLVHPSMYPLVWGRSAYFQDEIVGVQDAIAGQSTPQTTPKHAEVEKPNLTMRRMGYNIGSGTIPFELWSSKYQWLPSTVSFDGIGKPKFTSYINNLNPQKYSKMYNVLENLVDVVIPAWDQCLQEREIRRRGGEKATCSQAGRQGTRFDAVRDASDSNEDLWMPFDLEHWRNSDAKLTNEQLHELNEDCFREKEGDDAELSMEELEEFDRCEDEGEPVPTPHITEEALAREKWRQYRTPIYPEPGKYEPVDYTPTKSIRDMFKEHGLQIIVKMASIELTPEKPDFPGGSWHIEGQMNERICATALYYVDCENVTASKLAFRMSTDSYLGDDIKVGQDEYGWLEKVHGVSLGHSGGLPDACLQTYGDVETRQGRVLAFPNVFQHRVSPFSLEDKSKPGHRRFIALWLIDPHQRILSTANVPPQQRDWWEDAMKDHGARLLPSSFPKNLISVEEAKEHRQKLMEERSYIGKSHEVEWTRPEYNFCEH